MVEERDPTCPQDHLTATAGTLSWKTIGIGVTTKRLDEIARTQGWTHRLKRKSRDPYLKVRDGQTMYEGIPGGIFIDMDQKFRYIEFDEVIEL
jgi:hypothetical protein